MMIITNQTPRLQFVNQCILFSKIPVEIIRLIPHSVKPDGSDRTVISQKLCQLVIHELGISTPFSMAFPSSVSASPSQRIIVFSCPVQMRIIQMKGNALLGTFICQFLHDITFKWRCIHDIIIGILSIKHRETVMVTSCKTDIFCTCSLDSRNPFVRIEFRRIKSGSSLGIFMTVDSFILHVPFSLCIHTVYAPMQKDSKTIIIKLFSDLQI